MCRSPRRKAWESRIAASFYETAGALRDMIQSHVLQLTSLVSMEPPSAFDATAVRNEKIKVLQAIRPYTPELVARDVVRGQYGPGGVDGAYVPGYREEPGVRQGLEHGNLCRRARGDRKLALGRRSHLHPHGETHAPPRDAKLPFSFAALPHMVFRGQEMGANSLVLNIQPDEGISINFHAKLPGQEMRLADGHDGFQLSIGIRRWRAQRLCHAPE